MIHTQMCAVAVTCCACHTGNYPSKNLPLVLSWTGGRGEKSFFSYYGYPYHRRGDASCVGEDSACTPPPGNQGPPGCSLNATDSNSCALLSQPQVVL